MKEKIGRADENEAKFAASKAFRCLRCELEAAVKATISFRFVGFVQCEEFEFT